MCDICFRIFDCTDWKIIVFKAKKKKDFLTMRYMINIFSFLDEWIFTVLWIDNNSSSQKRSSFLFVFKILSVEEVSRIFKNKTCKGKKSKYRQ